MADSVNAILAKTTTTYEPIPGVVVPAASASTKAALKVAKVRRDLAGPQTLANNTPTYVTFDVLDLDTGEFWNASAPTKFTVPDNGIYRVEAQAFYDPNTTGYRELGVVVARAFFIAYMQELPTVSNAGGLHMRCQGMYQGTKGDVLEVQVNQTSGGNLNLTIGDGNFYTYFAVEQLCVTA